MASVIWSSTLGWPAQPCSWRSDKAHLSQ
uniref:Uncharacterized protein n=1 Tax=Anguilla anguilla TaxID=7936 RepID=A0A0E9VSH0_ANGAN